MNATKIFQTAVSVGAVESIIEQPSLMSHASYDAKARQAHGLNDGLIRISIGLEDISDLLSDLDGAFYALHVKRSNSCAKHVVAA